MALLMVGLAGCGNGTNGVGSVDGPDVSPTPVESAQAGAAALRPCTLLTAAEQRALELTERADETVGQARACEYRSAGRYSLWVGVFDTQSIAQVVSSGDRTPIRVGDRPAVQYEGPLKTCAIALQVSETSRVDVTVSANGDLQRGCKVANQTAAMVEAKLP